MTPDRWVALNWLWDDAFEVQHKRNVSLLGRCAQSVECDEVESLLAFEQQATQFLERSALKVIAEEFARKAPAVVGRLYGPYQLVSVLGVGGMGEVYKALVLSSESTWCGARRESIPSQEGSYA